jgi:hypothetical protein
MRLSNLGLASGLSNRPDNLTPLPDERDGPSSGLSRAPSGLVRRYERGCLGEIGKRG